MWVAAPTARAIPHEIDSRSYWLEEGLDPDKEALYFSSSHSYQRFLVIVGLTPHSLGPLAS